MNIFSRSYTYKGWQISLFKLSLVCFGIIVGAYWQEYFLQHLLTLGAIALVFGLYISYVTFRQ